jgi:hypothetical protein
MLYNIYLDLKAFRKRPLTLKQQTVCRHHNIPIIYAAIALSLIIPWEPWEPTGGRNTKHLFPSPDKSEGRSACKGTLPTLPLGAMSTAD